MKPQIHIAFAYFWPEFKPSDFKNFFPYVFEKYDLVLSQSPEVVFYSVFSPLYRIHSDQRYPSPEMSAMPAGNYVRVFLTGENIEPAMDACEFAITFSTLTCHPNHLRLPLWVYENRSWGFGPEQLIKSADVDWDRAARAKTGFANFVYSVPLFFRERIFTVFNDYKRVDAAGPCLNNMNGWCVPREPNRLQGKLPFVSRYKFTLAIENALWPGYQTEKLVDPMFAGSVPIYFGDPSASIHYNPDSYVDFSHFGSLKEMLDFVRALDNDDVLYRDMLAAPFYRENKVPQFAQDVTIAAFFDRIFEAALARRRGA